MIEHKLSRGDMLTLCIEETNMMGNGVAKADGMVVFCAGTVAGDVVIALITDVKKSYAVAKVLKVLQNSPCRTGLRCPDGRECGGCGFGEITYEHELYVKKKGIEAAFRRCGGLSVNAEDILPTETAEYRNKAVFHFDSELNTGYYAEGSRDFVRIGDCRIVHSVINNIRKKCEHLVKELSGGYKGRFTYLYIRYMKRTDEASVVLGYTGDESLLPVAEKLAEAFPCVKCFMTGKGDDPARDSFRSVLGGGCITDEFLGMKLEISPASFYQVNSEGAEKLCLCVSDFAELKDGDCCLDLYCGIGTIGLSVAKNNKGAKVLGVEINEKAVADAKRNAEINGISNAEFFAGDSGDFSKLCDEARPDCIIVDPPRAGLSDKAVSLLLNSSCSKIIYVSCNPSTVSRDFKKLSGSFKIRKVVGVDLFPGTLHVETVVLMSRKDLAI